MFSEKIKIKEETLVVGSNFGISSHVGNLGSTKTSKICKKREKSVFVIKRRNQAPINK